MVASKTIIPVIGVPIQTSSLSGLDSLYSIVQMPRGYPVATMAIGSSGAANAALLAASILALESEIIRETLSNWKLQLSLSVPEVPEEK
jgi:5-(carboxyamino)imidazole ribonucleotide mutase